MSNDGVDVRMSDGRLFHARGPATANARSPMVERRLEGTTRSADDTERRRRRAVLATGTASSVKYRGAAPVGTARRGLRGAAARPGPSSLYQM